MKAVDMLSKIKELVGVEASEQVLLAQATLENGTTIESESFDEGSEVFIVTEDEKVALPIGKYKLEDGEELVVEKEGIIKSIGKVEESPEEETKAEEVEVDAKEDDKKEEKDEMAYATKEELAELKSMIEEVKSMIEDKKKEEMAKQELAEVEKINHNPETSNDKVDLNLYAQNRAETTLDRIFNQLNKK